MGEEAPPGLALRSDPDAQARLARWLGDRLGAPSLRILSLGTPQEAGFSSESIFVDVETQTGEGRRSLVLRFENTAPPLFLGADLERQWRVLLALERHALPPTPRPVTWGDPDLFGVAFTVVEGVPGRPAPQAPNYNIGGWVHDLTPAERGLRWRNGIEAMAQVHRLDWRDGFDFLDQPGYGTPGLDQFLSWSEAWYEWARRGDRHPIVEQALRRLRDEQPEAPPSGLLWGDAGPNNLLFQLDGRVAAVLDWEAAALGPGEVDLAWWLFYDRFLSEGFGHRRLEGLPDRVQTIAIYEAAAGRPVADMAYYELFAHTRNAILSMRSVKRQVELGRIPSETRAFIHNPPGRLLADFMGLEASEVGEDYRAYLDAVLANKRR